MRADPGAGGMTITSEALGDLPSQVATRMADAPGRGPERRGTRGRAGTIARRASSGAGLKAAERVDSRNAPPYALPIAICKLAYT